MPSPLVEVSHVGIECAGKHSSNKKPRPVAILRAAAMATEEEGGFYVLCPHCKTALYIENEYLMYPTRANGNRNGIKYMDVSHRYEGK